MKNNLKINGMKKLIVIILFSSSTPAFCNDSRKCPEKFYTNVLSVDRADLSGIGIDNFLKNSTIKKDSVTKSFLAEPGFNAIKNDNGIDLTWTTVEETGVGVFTLQRTKDSIHFETISIIKSAAHSASVINYKETDYVPYRGTSWYRLLLSDNSGKNKYSALVQVTENVATRVILSNENNEALLVLRDKEGTEYYSKFVVTEDKGKLIATDMEKKISPGKYKVIAASNNKLFGKKIIVQ